MDSKNLSGSITRTRRSKLFNGNGHIKTWTKIQFHSVKTSFCHCSMHLLIQFQSFSLITRNCLAFSWGLKNKWHLDQITLKHLWIISRDKHKKTLSPVSRRRKHLSFEFGSGSVEKHTLIRLQSLFFFTLQYTRSSRSRQHYQDLAKKKRRVYTKKCMRLFMPPVENFLGSLFMSK